MSKQSNPELLASGGRKHKHTCSIYPESRTLGEGCPRLSRCMRALPLFGPCILVRFRLGSDGRATLPFATANFEAIHFISHAAVRDDANRLFALVHPEDFDRVMFSVTQAAQDITPWCAEYRILHPQTGRTNWLRSCLVPHRGTGNDLVGYGLLTDITAEKRFRAPFVELCERTSVAVFRTNLQGRYLSANRQFANLCGYESPKELIARSIRITTQFYVHPGERKALIDLLKTHGSIQRYPLEMRTKHGGSRWISLNVRTVRDAKGRIECCESYCADITDEVDSECRQGRFAELAHTRFGAGNAATQQVKKPAGNAPNGLCHLLTYVRDNILWRLNLSESG